MKLLQERLESLRQFIADAANTAINDFHWEEGGGACDAVADEIAGALQQAGIDSVPGGHDGDDHAWLIAYDVNQRSSFGVDIPAHVYETGGGYSWTRRTGAVVKADDINIWPINFRDIEDHLVDF